MADDEDFKPEWLWGAAAHALARLLARRRFGPGVDMSGAHNPTPGEERDASLFMRDLMDNGWLDPDQVSHLQTEVRIGMAETLRLEARQLRESSANLAYETSMGIEYAADFIEGKLQ